jgi:pyruvate dehydrogenase E2 component (dihydrolipoamide acetyltransferase)
MSVEIRMPSLSSDVQEADLISWLVKPGDRVERGQVVAEIETDKSAVELEAEASGVVREIRVPEGTADVAVGTVLAVLDEEEAAAAEAAPDEPSTTQAARESEAAAPPAEAARAEAGEETAESGASAGERPAATALARRLAGQQGLDLDTLAGTGARGRVVRADVEAALQRDAEPAPAPERSRAAEVSSDTPHQLVPHSRMRRTIATRLAEAKRTIPHFYLRIECRVDRLLETRRHLNETEPEVKLSVNDFAIRAAALALRDLPEANVAWSDEGLLRFERVDMAVAVATENGLITPILRGAERKSLRAISLEMRDLAARARAGRLRPDEYRGGTFCVSNLGMYGVESVLPILNPPQAAILGVGAAEPRPVVQDGDLAVATCMTCTLSADHRAIDGALGAQLLAAIRKRIEDPLEMLL